MKSNVDVFQRKEIEAPFYSNKEWLSPIELETEFGIKRSTQNKMRMKGVLPYSKIGKFVRYSRTKINQMFVDAEVI